MGDVQQTCCGGPPSDNHPPAITLEAGGPIPQDGLMIWGHAGLVGLPSFPIVTRHMQESLTCFNHEHFDTAAQNCEHHCRFQRWPAPSGNAKEYTWLLLASTSGPGVISLFETKWVVNSYRLTQAVRWVKKFWNRNWRITPGLRTIHQSLFTAFGCWPWTSKPS